MIKIITTKKYNAMVAERDSLQAELKKLRGELLNLHALHRGDWNKHMYEHDKMQDEIEDLKKKLSKSEHERKTAEAKLRKLTGGKK